MTNPRIHETPSPSARTSGPRLSSTPSVQFAASLTPSEAFKVYVRVRPTPLNLSEDKFRSKEVLRVQNTTSVGNEKKLRYVRMTRSDWNLLRS